MVVAVLTLAITDTQQRKIRNLNTEQYQYFMNRKCIWQAVRWRKTDIGACRKGVQSFYLVVKVYKHAAIKKSYLIHLLRYRSSNLLGYNQIYTFRKSLNKSPTTELHTGLLMRPEKDYAKADRKCEAEPPRPRPKIFCKAEAKTYEAEATVFNESCNI